jgi:hypothetical protein
MVRLILSILLISNIVYADDSVYLNQKQPAPFSGYLLPETTVKQLRNDSLELDLYKTTNTLKDQQIALLGAQNTSLSTTLKETSTLSTWERVGYFAAGVLLTALAVDGASKIINH